MSCHDRMMRWLLEFSTTDVKELCPDDIRDYRRHYGFRNVLHQYSQDNLETTLVKLYEEYDLFLPPWYTDVVSLRGRCLHFLHERLSNSFCRRSTDETKIIEDQIKEAMEIFQGVLKALFEHERVVKMIHQWYLDEIKKLNKSSWFRLLISDKRRAYEEESSECLKVASFLKNAVQQFEKIYNKWKLLYDFDEPRPPTVEIMTSNILPRDLLKIVDAYYFHRLHIDDMLEAVNCLYFQLPCM